MSVKIYGGRIIRAPIGRAYQMLMEAKPGAIAIGERLQAKWMVERAVDIIDHARLKGEEAENPLFDAWQELVDKVKKLKAPGAGRDPSADFEFEAWLFPLRNRTLMMVQSEQREMQSWIDDLPFVERYGYWDNTDPDEDVSARQWRQRGKDWLEVLPWGSAPSDRCMTLVMFNDSMPMPASDEVVATLIPPVEGRLARAAANQHINEVYKALVAEEREKNPDFKPEGFSLFFKAERASRDDLKRREAIKAEIAHAILEVTVEDLSIQVNPIRRRREEEKTGTPD